MTALPISVASPGILLDFAVVRRGLLYFAGACLICAPFARDPLSFAVGGAALPLLVAIVARPNAPVVVVYFIFVTWLQIFARLLVTAMDGESLGNSLLADDLVRAYWYSLATAFALARENRMPIIVFSIREKGAIEAVLRGKGRSTIVGG